MLDSPLPTIVLWGRQLIQVYNDAYQPILGQRHPTALGQPTRECWPEVWGFNEPIYRRVQDGGERVHFEDQEYVIEPSGVPESRFFTITYTPARDESGQVHGVTVIAMDTTQRVRVERERSEARLAQSRLNEQLVGNVQRLQQLDRHRAFQLALADGLRTLSAPDAAIDLASALLGRHLDVSRVMYAEVDESAGTFTIRRDWTARGLVSISGEARQLNDFGPEIITSLRGGHPMVVDSIALDPRTAAFARAYAAIDVRANLAIPLVKSGRMIAILSLQNAQPRHWTAEEVELSQEVAERTWATAEAARAEADLRAERDQSQHVFDSMTEGMALLDRNWVVVRMNAEGLRLGQRTGSQVIGRSHWDVWPEAVGSDIDRFYRKVMETRVAGAIEYRHSFSSDLHTWFEVRAHPTPEGGLAVLYRDIGERRQIHERLHASDRRKDEFLAMLAHELRNPLAPISAAAHLLKVGKVDEARIRQTSEIIGRQVQHLTSLVDDLLDVSRVSRGQVELEKMPLEMRDVVVDAVEQVNPLILQRGHHLVLHLAPGAARVLGDAKRLVQVIANLAGGAGAGRADRGGPDPPHRPAAWTWGSRWSGAWLSCMAVRPAASAPAWGMAVSLPSRCVTATLIAVTGYGQEQDRSNSLAAGFNEHMVKPLDIDRLEALLLAVVQR